MKIKYYLVYLGALVKSECVLQCENSVGGYKNLTKKIMF